MTSRTGRRSLSWNIGLLAVVAAVVVTASLSYLWFFTYTLRPQGELLTSRPSPNGEWVYRMYYVNMAGAVGSATYRIEVAPAGDPQTGRVVYDGAGQAQTEWVDGTTLRIGGRDLDVRDEHADAFGAQSRPEVLAHWLLVAVPSALVALVGGVVLWYARRHRVASVVSEGGQAG